ncbi:MAG: hypothetical protein RLZ35_641 [Pseudomonadota bacterium]|jgi:hypothetical protein
MQDIRLLPYRILMLTLLCSSLVYAADSNLDLENTNIPPNNGIKPIQFIVSVYRAKNGTRQMSQDSGTESMRIADGQAAFMGSAQEVPLPQVTAAKASNNSSVKAVSYQKLESGLELRPHLMGRVVQLEISEKNETWNDQTQAVELKKSHAVVMVPLDQWSKVKGTLDDNEDIEDIYGTDRGQKEELWVRVQLAPN